jgi:hypothetical protein
MAPQRFIVLSRRGSIGFGVFPEVPWHKTANEDILQNLGFRIEYGEQLQASQDKGSYKTVSDLEHSEMLTVYLEEGLGYVKIAEKLHRSSRTPKVHVDAHNRAIRRSGFYALCKRAQSKYASTIAEDALDELKAESEVAP